MEWRLKKRSATSPRGIARGRPIANGTDGTNARVASLFPPANRVKSPCPPRSSIRGEPRQPAPLTPTDLPPPLLLSTVAPLLFLSLLSPYEYLSLFFKKGRKKIKKIKIKKNGIESFQNEQRGEQGKDWKYISEEKKVQRGEKMGEATTTTTTFSSPPPPFFFFFFSSPSFARSRKVQRRESRRTEEVEVDRWSAREGGGRHGKPIERREGRAERSNGSWSRYCMALPGELSAERRTLRYWFRALLSLEFSPRRRDWRSFSFFLFWLRLCPIRVTTALLSSRLFRRRRIELSRNR